MAKSTKKSTTKSTHKKGEDPHVVFLAALCSFGNVSKAARKAKLDRSGLYAKRRENPGFAKIWDEALEVGTAALEDEAKRRAHEGWLEPVWHKGQKCGSVRKFSDTLMIVLLKAHMPEKYKENSKVDHTSSDGSMATSHSPVEVMAELLRRKQEAQGQ